MYQKRKLNLSKAQGLAPPQGISEIGRGRDEPPQTNFPTRKPANNGFNYDIQESQTIPSPFDRQLIDEQDLARRLTNPISAGQQRKPISLEDEEEEDSPLKRYSVSNSNQLPQDSLRNPPYQLEDLEFDLQESKINQPQAQSQATPFRQISSNNQLPQQFAPQIQNQYQQYQRQQPLDQRKLTPEQQLRQLQFQRPQNRSLATREVPVLGNQIDESVRTPRVDRISDHLDLSRPIEVDRQRNSSLIPRQPYLAQDQRGSETESQLPFPSQRQPQKLLPGQNLKTGYQYAPNQQQTQSSNNLGEDADRHFSSQKKVSSSTNLRQNENPLTRQHDLENKRLHFDQLENGNSPRQPAPSDLRLGPQAQLKQLQQQQQQQQQQLRQPPLSQRQQPQEPQQMGSYRQGQLAQFSSRESLGQSPKPTQNQGLFAQNNHQQHQIKLNNAQKVPQLQLPQNLQQPSAAANGTQKLTLEQQKELLSHKNTKSVISQAKSKNSQNAGPNANVNLSANNQSHLPILTDNSILNTQNNQLIPFEIEENSQKNAPASRKELAKYGIQSSRDTEEYEFYYAKIPVFFNTANILPTQAEVGDIFKIYTIVDLLIYQIILPIASVILIKLTLWLIQNKINNYCYISLCECNDGPEVQIQLWSWLRSVIVYKLSHISYKRQVIARINLEKKPYMEAFLLYLIALGIDLVMVLAIEVHSDIVYLAIVFSLGILIPTHMLKFRNFFGTFWTARGLWIYDFCYVFQFLIIFELYPLIYKDLQKTYGGYDGRNKFILLFPVLEFLLEIVMENTLNIAKTGCYFVYQMQMITFGYRLGLLVGQRVDQFEFWYLLSAIVIKRIIQSTQVVWIPFRKSLFDNFRSRLTSMGKFSMYYKGKNGAYLEIVMTFLIYYFWIWLQGSVISPEVHNRLAIEDCRFSVISEFRDIPWDRPLIVFLLYIIGEFISYQLNKQTGYDMIKIIGAPNCNFVDNILIRLTGVYFFQISLLSPLLLLRNQDLLDYVKY